MAGKSPKTGAEAADARRFLNARQRRFYEAVWPALTLLERHAPHDNGVLFNQHPQWEPLMAHLEATGEFTPEELDVHRQRDAFGTQYIRDKMISLATPDDLTQALRELSFENFPPYPAQDYFHLASMFDTHLRFAGYSDRYYLTVAPMPDLWRATHDAPLLNPGQQANLDAGRAVLAFFQERGLWPHVKPLHDQPSSDPQQL
ncbi:hypothetical protein [Deinococcus soli (ex Cha et al. 2016)]|uniref:Uncharacterized protein n=2 Tax=Deinococcus soli (ex Cha et al. 2016) TaxID=1309411 RepID=A0ACC6KGH1_9DEIO|nr:hypothetical protein [Deinococcus soli (ex Cha et al. 2016)]MDR6218154.1 hypothetical protein [Deinococcus soli (ex Cha et al. 2016)]MDR6328894.1 hypothetical protein [Deinococcus soli (ex Cha et al. 2016)]MDR6751618.1 hypothetical protein [Deinococcus soli (ex Cha et al. 2016)]